MQQDETRMFSSFIPVSDLPPYAQDNEQGLIDFVFTLLPLAAQLAVVPISHFRVGAAAIDGEGNIFLGANQEFAGAVLAQTIHAEQSAVAHAWSKGAKQIKHIVVDTPPCGHCRQFLNEMLGAQIMQVHLPNRKAAYLHDFLPEHFGPVDLGLTERLFSAPVFSLQAEGHSELEKFALHWACHAYAPYSGMIAGIAVQDKFGGVHGGAYLENAAFNPSLPPLQMALNSLHLQGLSVADIIAGCLVCVPNSGHDVHTRALWESITIAPLTIIMAEKK